MQRDGLSLGGEESGHIIFSRYASTGDGLITAIKVMEVLVESKRPSNELCRDFRMYPQYLVNVKTMNKDAVMTDKDVLDAISAAEKMLGEKGRVLLRKSGTEPVVRVMAEAETHTLCKETVEGIVHLIEKKYSI